jgi:uncharacterized membrane protein
MQSLLFILLGCAAADLIGSLLLIVLVWFEHRRVRKEAAAAGESVPSAAAQLGCLSFFALAGVAVIYGTAWLLLR